MFDTVKKVIGGRFFTVEFTKKDGTLRRLNGRFGVTKHLKGGKTTLNDDYLIVFDCHAKGYRAVNKQTIKQINFGGVQWKF